MTTETGWRTHQRTADDLPERNLFPGRPIDEGTESGDDSWSSTFGDMTHQMPELPSYAKTVGFAAVAAAGGMAVGYWIGGRRSSRRRSSFTFGDVDVADFAKLVPEVTHLLKHPMVRAYLTRMAMQRIRRSLDD